MGHALMLSAEPQWSPVMKTGNTAADVHVGFYRRVASMEPGHEDREYPTSRPQAQTHPCTPQWSPVMKTGNTRAGRAGRVPDQRLNGARS